MDNALCRIAPVRSFGRDLSNAPTKPSFSSSIYKPYRQVNKFKTSGASTHRASQTYTPAWRNISCPPECSPYMMQSPVNHNLKITPARSNLTSTGFRPGADQHLNIANYKGSAWKETVTPFYTKERRARTKTNH